MATSERWKDKQSGEQQERTTWHYCEAWGRLAEICSEYLSKGSQVYVEGKIRQEEWEKNGETQRMTKVRMDSMQMLGRSDGQGGGQSRPPQQRKAAPAGAQNAPDDNFDDDIPF